MEAGDLKDPGDLADSSPDDEWLEKMELNILNHGIYNIHLH